jgi:hypothetical protein
MRDFVTLVKAAVIATIALPLFLLWFGGVVWLTGWLFVQVMNFALK